MSTSSCCKRRPAMKVAGEGRTKEDAVRTVHPTGGGGVSSWDGILDRILLAVTRQRLWSPEDAVGSGGGDGDGDGAAGLAGLLAAAGVALGRQVAADGLQARWDATAPSRMRLQSLLLSPGIPQRTPEWYEARTNLITASDAAQALGCSKFGNQRTFFMKKCGLPEEQAPFDASAPPLKWGVMYEPVAQSIYSAVNAGVRVHEFGLLRHPELPFLGASPDGITELGVMLEIKCPWRRRIVEGEVPTQYYYQIQAQLAVCGLQECDYFECEFFEVTGADDPEWSRLDMEPYARGAFAEVSFAEKPTEYVYPPWGAAGGSREDLDAFMAAVGADRERGGDAVTVRQHWWVLRKRSTSRVIFDSDFVADMVSRLRIVWQRVHEYRGDRNRYEAEVLCGAAAFSPPPPAASGGTASPHRRASDGNGLMSSGYAFIDDENEAAGT